MCAKISFYPFSRRHKRFIQPKNFQSSAASQQQPAIVRRRLGIFGDYEERELIFSV